MPSASARRTSDPLAPSTASGCGRGHRAGAGGVGGATTARRWPPRTRTSLPPSESAACRGRRCLRHALSPSPNCGSALATLSTVLRERGRVLHLGAHAELAVDASPTPTGCRSAGRSRPCRCPGRAWPTAPACPARSRRRSAGRRAWSADSKNATSWLRVAQADADLAGPLDDLGGLVAGGERQVVVGQVAPSVRRLKSTSTALFCAETVRPSVRSASTHAILRAALGVLALAEQALHVHVDARERVARAGPRGPPRSRPRRGCRRRRRASSAASSSSREPASTTTSSLTANEVSPSW